MKKYKKGQELKVKMNYQDTNHYLIMVLSCDKTGIFANYKLIECDEEISNTWITKGFFSTDEIEWIKEV